MNVLRLSTLLVAIVCACAGNPIFPPQYGWPIPPLLGPLARASSSHAGSGGSGSLSSTSSSIGGTGFGPPFDTRATTDEYQKCPYGTVCVEEYSCPLYGRSGPTDARSFGSISPQDTRHGQTHGSASHSDSCGYNKVCCKKAFISHHEPHHCRGPYCPPPHHHQGYHPGSPYSSHHQPYHPHGGYGGHVPYGGGHSSYVSTSYGGGYSPYGGGHSSYGSHSSYPVYPSHSYSYSTGYGNSGHYPSYPTAYGGYQSYPSYYEPHYSSYPSYSPYPSHYPSYSPYPSYPSYPPHQPYPSRYPQHGGFPETMPFFSAGAQGSAPQGDGQGSPTSGTDGVDRASSPAARTSRAF